MTEFPDQVESRLVDAGGDGGGARQLIPLQKIDAQAEHAVHLGGALQPFGDDFHAALMGIADEAALWRVSRPEEAPRRR